MAEKMKESNYVNEKETNSYMNINEVPFGYDNKGNEKKGKI